MFFFDTLINELASREVDKLERKAYKLYYELQNLMQKHIDELEEIRAWEPVITDAKNRKIEFSKFEENYLRAREKVKHNPKKRVEIAKDWLDYLDSTSALEAIADSASRVGDEDGFYESLAKEHLIRLDETKKKFDKVLNM